MDTFLEREKELMKLNESLNSKISFDWKAPNVAVIASTLATTKSKNKPPSPLNKSIKTESPQSKSTPTTVRSTIIKSKIDSCDNSNGNGNSSNKNTTNSNSAHTADGNTTAKKRDLDWKDNAYGANSRNIDANKNEQSAIKTSANEFATAIADKIISNDRNEISASALSLIPQNMMKRNVNSDGIIKFLKAKVTILQQELDLSHQENVKNLDKIAKSTEQYKKLEAVRCQGSNTINSLNSQIKKHQQNETNAALKLKESEAIQSSQRKECDELKAKLKALQQLNSSLEIRLNKCQDDLECVRKNYQTVKAMQKDLQTTLQHDRTFYDNQLKITQKQRSDLLTALKKQMLLMENLKRQNVCLAQAKSIQMAENEFLKVLDWTNVSKK